MTHAKLRESEERLIERLRAIADDYIGKVDRAACIETEAADTITRLEAELSAARAGLEHVELLEEVCARYADDEDAFLDETGEPFGSITTECGMMARSARTRFRARQAAITGGE